MAEGKKPEPVILSNAKTTERIIGLLVVLILLTLFINAVKASLSGLGTSGGIGLWGRIVNYSSVHIWPWWKWIAAILSIFSAIGIVNNFSKLSQINAEENKVYGATPELGIVRGVQEEQSSKQKNEKWEKVLEYSNSTSSSDWRLAIIEADVILEELLRDLGYYGDSIGEMLKAVDKSDFNTLDEAWEAHKVRNQIAHAGGGFQLNERETKRVVTLFEKVFKEFQII